MNNLLTKKCEECNENYVKNNRNRFCSVLCTSSWRKKRKHINSPAWKNEVGYSAIHKWISLNFGKAHRCENKGSSFLGFKCVDKFNRFHWALIHGKKYDRNIDNFMMLCTSCHSKYDSQEDWLSISRIKIKSTKSKVSEWIESNGFGLSLK